ncbi:MAG TPA: VOC family protein [Xanthobacteraceae bacterium]|nr:VOC family protein [Xanthobacteraceae bacterium]
MTLPRIDHIGIIVPDLEAAVGRLSALLGGLAPQRRDLPELDLHIAEFQTANLAIELIAYSGPAAFARRVMGGEIGLNHITVAVESVDGALERLAQAGFVAQPGFPRRGAHGKVAFFERDRATGLLFEVCAPEKAKEQP